MRLRILRGMVAACLLWGAARLTGDQQPEGLGSAVITPARYEAGTVQDFRVEYTVGARGMKTGGSLKVQFPRAYHFSAWMYRSPKNAFVKGSSKEYQTTDPDGWNYVGGVCSRDGVTVEAAVTSKDDLDYREGYPYRNNDNVFHAKVTSGALQKGDRITLWYKKTTGSVVRETHVIPMAVDTDGDGTFHLLPDAPELTVTASDAREILLYGPSQAAAGQPVQYHISVLDRYGNQADSYRGQITLAATDPQAELPSVIEMTPEDQGLAAFTVSYKTVGIQRIRLADNVYIANTTVMSNPVEVLVSPQPKQVFWGELHAHTYLSLAAIGLAKTAYAYGRDVSRLDFLAITPQRTRGEKPREDQYDINRRLVREYHDPGRFVTFLGYEWQTSEHNNVIFLRDDAQIPWAYNYPTLPELWKQLRGQDALTIPHHTGIRFTGYFDGYQQDYEERWVKSGPAGLLERSNAVDWNHRDPLRVAGEIYSLHGSSEYYLSPGNYEEVDNTFASATPGPHYLRDAWERGHIIGVVGANDDHFAHPGRHYGGVTGAWAESQTREAIFNAIRDRHTYATTGHRMLLKFTVNDQLMGSMVRLPEGNKPVLKISANAMGEIGVVEVFKYDGFKWTTILQTDPRAMDTDIAFTDHGYTTSCLYYVRVTQKDLYHAPAEVRPRQVMAWSSPVWVTSRETAWWETFKSNDE